MKLGKVVGTVVSTINHPFYDARRLLVCDLITLEVRESNDSARRLYDAHGFVVVGRRKNYYQDDREDAVVMTLDLRDLRGGEDA